MTCQEVVKGCKGCVLLLYYSDFSDISMYTDSTYHTNIPFSYSLSSRNTLLIVVQPWSIARDLPRAVGPHPELSIWKVHRRFDELVTVCVNLAVFFHFGSVWPLSGPFDSDFSTPNSTLCAC